MSLNRVDHTNYLVHWTSGGLEEAIEKFKSIAVDGILYGNNYGVRSKDNCICCTEAPVENFHIEGSRYKPFGIRFSKRWYFSQGGRPVIYQPEEDYQSLDESIRWKHVDFDLRDENRCDYSWGREWRLKREELVLPIEEAVLIIPDESYRESFVEYFRDVNFWRGVATSADPYLYWDLYPESPGDKYKIESIIVDR